MSARLRARQQARGRWLPQIDGRAGAIAGGGDASRPEPATSIARDADSVGVRVVYAEIHEWDNGVTVHLEPPLGRPPRTLEGDRFYWMGDLACSRIRELMVKHCAGASVSLSITLGIDVAEYFLDAARGAGLVVNNLEVRLKWFHREDHRPMLKLCMRVAAPGAEMLVQFDGPKMQPFEDEVLDTLIDGGFKISGDWDPLDAGLPAARREIPGVKRYEPIPESKSYAKQLPPVSDQKGWGACLAHAVSNVLMIHLRMTRPDIDAAIDPMWFYTKRDSDDSPGMDTKQMIDILMDLLAAKPPPANDPVGRMTHYVLQFVPIKEAKSITNVWDARYALATVGPLLLSLMCYSCAPEFWQRQSSDGKGVMHAVVVYAYAADSGEDGGGYFMLRNSWGKADHKMSFADFERYAVNCLILVPGKRVDRSFDPRSVL